MIARFVRAFGRFWFDLVIGDDPKIAVGVVGVTLCCAVLLLTDAVAAGLVPVIGFVLFAAAFTLGLRRDVRRMPSRPVPDHQEET